jgi:Tfp pilus assembly ATPase PilU
MTTKEALHRLIDNMPDEQAEQLMTGLNNRDPIAVSLALAPIDDEPLTPEEEAALAEADDDVARGNLISTEQLRRELGL